MTNDALQKTLSLVTLITAGILQAQNLKHASGAEKRATVLTLVQLGEAGTELFAPGVLKHPEVEGAAGDIIDAIVKLSNATTRATAQAASDEPHDH